MSLRTTFPARGYGAKFPQDVTRFDRKAGWRWCLLLAACLAGSEILLSAAGASSWFIQDPDGRALILHGLNVSCYAKSSPNFISWHAYEDYRRMKQDWGFNAIRLLIFWEAVEPSPGVYDDEYLAAVAERLSWAEQLGLYVIIDLHQDLYSRKFNGDGAPLWATWDDDLPFTPSSPWWVNYAAPAVSRSFTHLWTETELKRHLIAAWVHVAEALSGSSALIGYDLLNEPYFGEIWPITFEQSYLKMYYLQVMAAINTVDAGRYYFYEPEILCDAGIPSFLGAMPAARVVYAPHYYDFLVHAGNPYAGNPWSMWQVLTQHEHEAEQGAAPLMLGEFGVASTTAGMDRYLSDQLDIFDRYRACWTYWTYDRNTDDAFGIIDADGNELGQLDRLVRPYPQKIAGDPLLIRYLPDEQVMYVDFTARAGVAGPTEIFTAATRIFPNGFVVSCWDPPGTWSWQYDETNQVVQVWTTAEQTQHRIIIAPRYQDAAIERESPRRQEAAIEPAGL